MAIVCNYCIKQKKYLYNYYLIVVFNRVRVYGPGIESVGPVIGAPANFTVETFSAGKGKFL